MHALVSTAALFLFAGSLVSSVSAQDTVGSKKFRINFRIDEKTNMVEPVELWVTRDQGETWRPAREEGVLVTWGAYSAGKLSVTVAVPRDGPYGFYLQLKDKVSNQSSPPSAGTNPGTRVNIVTNHAPKWIFPAEGDTLQGGEEVRLRWNCPAEIFLPGSVSIGFEIGGRVLPWKSKLPLKGDIPWLPTPYASDTPARLRLTAKDLKGRERQATVSVRIRKVPSRVRWIFPVEGDTLQGGEKVRLRWECPAEFYRPGSVSIEFEFSGRFLPWKSKLPLTGDLPWRVTPYASDTPTRLRLTAKDLEGRERQATVSVRIRKVPPRIIGRIQWIAPESGARLEAGRETNLRWRCTLDAFERTSVTLEWRKDGGDWEALGDHLPRIHQYRWRVPRNVKNVELRLSAKDLRGVVRDALTRFEVEQPVIVITARPKWIEPKNGAEVLVGSKMQLRWSCDPKSYTKESVVLSYTMNGRSETIRSGLSLAGDLEWTLPGVPGRIRLRISAIDRAAEQRSAYTDILASKIDPVVALRWISPVPGTRVEGGTKIRLKWRAAPEFFRPKSVAVSYITGGTEKEYRKGLSLSNSMEWVVPTVPGPVRLQLSALDKSGELRVQTTDLWVEVTDLADHLKWISPVEGSTILAGSRIRLKWDATESLFRATSVALSYLVGGKESEISKHLPLSGSMEWTAPSTPGPLRLRFMAFDRTGRDRSAYNDLRVKAIRIADHMRWISPVPESKVTSNSRIMLKWSCSEEFFQENSVSLNAISGGVEKSVADGIRLSGHLEWVAPRIAGPLRLQLTARDQTGQLRHLYNDLYVRSPVTEKMTRPEWIQPKDGSHLISGQHIILQWKVPGDRFRPRTVHLAISMDGVEYQPLAENRPLRGTYQWRIPPLTRDRRMWLRLRADNNTGTTEQMVSKVMVRFIPPIAKPKPKWVFPKIGDELKGGERVTLQWLGALRDFKQGSVSIAYSFDGSAPMTLSSGLSVTGDYAWRVPKQEGNLTLVLRAMDRSGIERLSSVRVSIREPRVLMIARPEWRQPTTGDELIADVLTPLRWRTMEGDYRQKSVTISYSVDGSAWQPIVKGRRLNDTLLWRAPREAGGRVSLRLTAERTDGSVQHTDTGPFLLARKKREELIVRWVQPSPDESIPADSKVVLRWSCPKEGYQPGSVVLSASTDGGNTWDPIEQKRPLEGEHVWRVSAPPGSDVTLRASVLETNGRERETFVHVKVIQSMELKPEWLQPGIGDEVPAGAAKILRWHTPKEGFLQDSVAIFASVDEGPEDLVGKVLPLSGSLWYRIPDEEGGRLRLRLVARTAKGREVAAILDELLIKTSAQKLLSWIHPRESGVWKGGETVQLQWTSLRGDLREKSAHLYYSVDGGRWTLVTRGLDPAAFYFWTVPWRNGAQLRLKVTARTRGGTEVEAVTPTVTVEATTRPDIAMAKRHADRARIHVARNQTAQASLEYEKALAIWPDYPEALNDLGTVYSSEKQYAKALEYFLRAKRSAPSSPFPYVNAASMEIQLGLPIDALEDLRDSVELGVDRHQRLALQAGERLWQLSKLFQISGESERSEDACGLILRIRTADRRLRRQAEAALTGSGGR